MTLQFKENFEAPGDRHAQASHRHVPKQLFEPYSSLHGPDCGQRSAMNLPFFRFSTVLVGKELEFKIGTRSIQIGPSATGIGTMYSFVLKQVVER